MCGTGGVCVGEAARGGVVGVVASPPPRAVRSGSGAFSPGPPEREGRGVAAAARQWEAPPLAAGGRRGGAGRGGRQWARGGRRSGGSPRR